MMDTWQVLMTKGNELYERQRWNEAIDYYNQAITQLEHKHVLKTVETQQALQGWICGYHNIATTYERQGMIKCSRDTLLIPFRTMMSLTCQGDVSTEMKIIAHHALKITLPPLLEFANKYPTEFKFINTIVEQLNEFNYSGITKH